MFVTIPYLSRFLELEANLLQRVKASDYVDRLHSVITPWLLALGAALVGSRVYFGDPISCMFPKDIDEQPTWTSYFHQYCFVTNTYKYNSISRADGVHFVDYQPNSTINYYQWVPFMLTAQMIAFCLPAFFWRLCVEKATIRYESVISTAKRYQYERSDDNRGPKTLASIADCLIDTQVYERIRDANKAFGMPSTRCILAMAYIFYKIITIVNVLVQLYILGFFLGIDSWDMGLLQVQALIDPVLHNNTGFGVFPRTVMCHVEKSTSFGQEARARPVQYDVQCLLFVNYINEKIFLFIWFWFLILLAVSVCNFFSWLFLILFPTSPLSVQGIYDHSGRNIGKNKECAYKTFFSQLGADGRLLFGFIAIHGGELTLVEVVDEILNRLNKKQAAVGSAEKEGDSKKSVISLTSVHNEITSDTAPLIFTGSEKKPKFKKAFA